MGKEHVKILPTSQRKASFYFMLVLTIQPVLIPNQSSGKNCHNLSRRRTFIPSLIWPTKVLLLEALMATHLLYVNSSRMVTTFACHNPMQRIWVFTENELEHSLLYARTKRRHPVVHLK